MKPFAKFVLIVIVFVSFSNTLEAQVYLGGGRAVSLFTPASLDHQYGYGAILQRQIYLKESRFSLTPTLQGALLTNRQYFEYLPEYYTTVTLSTHLNYDVLSTNKFRITPFAGPSFIWATGLQAGGLVFDSLPVNFYRLGLEAGLSATYIYSENFSVKFIPLNYTWGTREYVQGNVLSFLFQIK